MKKSWAIHLFVVITTALVVLVPTGRSYGTQLGGTLKFNGAFSINSPCDNADLSTTAGLQVTGVVSVFDGQTFVYVTFFDPNLTATPTDGNTYKMNGQAVAAYSTLVTGGLGGPQGSFYQLPMDIDFDTSSSAFNFHAQQNISIVVDSNQKPIQIFTAGVSATCGK